MQTHPLYTLCINSSLPHLLPHLYPFPSPPFLLPFFTFSPPLPLYIHSLHSLISHSSFFLINSHHLSPSHHHHHHQSILLKFYSQESHYTHFISHNQSDNYSSIPFQPQKILVSWSPSPSKPDLSLLFFLANPKTSLRVGELCPPLPSSSASKTAM